VGGKDNSAIKYVTLSLQLIDFINRHKRPIIYSVVEHIAKTKIGEVNHG